MPAFFKRYLSFIAARRESPTPLAKRQVSLGQRTDADGAEKSAFVSHPVEPAVELLEEAHRREPAVDFVALALVLDEVDEGAGNRQDDFIVARAQKNERPSADGHHGAVLADAQYALARHAGEAIRRRHARIGAG